MTRWHVTPRTESWLDGNADNHGFAVKLADESQAARLEFHSSQATDPAVRPKLSVYYHPLHDRRDHWTFQPVYETERRQVAVNVASGDLDVRERDITIPGTGLDLLFERHYASRTYKPRRGAGVWGLNLSSIMWLQDTPEGGKRVNDRAWRFDPDGQGGYTSPSGLNATLTENADGSAQLEFHASGETWHWDQWEAFQGVSDRNGNRLQPNWQLVDGLWTITSLSDTQGRVTTFDHTHRDRVLKATDPAGREHVYTYDGDLLTGYTNPAGDQVAYEYDGPQGKLSAIIDEEAGRTEFTYTSVPWDALPLVASVTRVTDPATGAGPTTTFTYAQGQTKVTDARGHTTIYHYDRMGRVTKTVDALGHERTSSYNANSNVTSYTRASSPGGTPVTNSYDERNNLTGVTLPTGASWSLDYDDTAHPFSPTRFVNPQGNALTYDYDAPGNLAGVTDSTAQQGRYELAYNPDGTVASMTDPNANTTSYGYDAAGNLVTITPPAPLGATTIGYDGLSRVTAVTDGKGQQTTYTYDVLDRVTHVGFADASGVSYSYDKVGNRTAMTDATGTTATSYDALYRVVGESFPDGRSTSYTYDAVGNLTALTDGGGTVGYAYNAVNVLAQLTEPDGATTSFAYNPDNQRTHTGYPNGVSQQAVYDDSGRLTSMTATTTSGATLTAFDYTYTDPASGTDTALRQSMTDRDANTTAYTYDGADRLVRARTSSPAGAVVADHVYGYDPASNRTSETINGASVTATFNAANQLVTRDGVTYTYDANGNQTGNSAGQQLAYNAADQTTSMQAPGGTALTAAYAGPDQWERRAAGAHTFGHTILGVSDRAGATTAQHYTRDATGGLVGLREGSTRAYYLFDGLGSVAAVTDATGSVTNRYSYDPYGTTSETTFAGAMDSPWRYTGEYQDPTGLYKIGMRYYQPELGRWTQADPLGQRINPAQPAEAHPYNYVGCNPVNYTDPTGMLVGECFWEYAQLVAAITSLGFSIASTGLSAGATIAASVASAIGVVGAAQNYNDCILAGGTVF